jgi:hypothetical protein
MDCTPQGLIALAECVDECVPAGLMGASQIASACAWVNGGGGPPCTLPTAPVDLGASAGDSQVTLTWPAGVGATGYNIKRALVSGGPYTVIGTSAASPYVDLTSVNGTTYYYVVSSTNACGESVGNSLESHGKPLAPFSYAPATSIITWTDMNGAGQSGNLAFFNATADISTVTYVTLSNQSLTAISNLSSLPSLYYLEAINNSITSLDLTGCNSLGYLDIPQNLITILDVSPCHATLVSFACNSNSLTILNVTGCTALTYLNCAGNSLTTLNVSNFTALVYLYCHLNSLTTLNPTGCTALTTLECENNSLTALDVHTCTALVTFNCYSNPFMTSLNVTGCTALTYLAAYLCVLTSVDVHTCTALATLYVNNNALTSLNASGCAALTVLYCNSNVNFGTIDVTGCTALTNLNCSLCTLVSLDLSTCVALTTLTANSYYLTSVNISGCSALVSCNVANNNVPTSEVNTILSTLVGFGHTGGTVNTAGQFPAAPPSVGPPNGIVAKAALLAEVPAWTVTTD